MCRTAQSGIAGGPRRGVGISLDPAQRAVPRQRAAPAQQAQNMSGCYECKWSRGWGWGIGCQTFQPGGEIGGFLLRVVNTFQPDGSRPVRPESARPGCSRSRRRGSCFRIRASAGSGGSIRSGSDSCPHRPRSACRSWGPACANRIIGFLEAGPFGGREFEAEEPPAMLQHAVRLGQSLVDVG
jgi:hypothetical protein